MNQLKFYTILVFSLIGLLAGATDVKAVGSGAVVVVYNSGRALVRDVRVVTLPKGLASVVIRDVPATLDPTSVRIMARELTVYDLQYSYNPITVKTLLDEYLGKELSVILPDPADANARTLRKAKLVSNADRPIFLIGNEVYIGSYEAVLLPELPKELETEPTLTLTTKTGTAGKKDVTLNYLMGGLNWRADYALTVSGDGASAALDAWATLTNTSGSGFQSANVRLVAGDVHQAPLSGKNSRAKGMLYMKSAEMDTAPSWPAEEPFSQYHVYNIARSVSLAPRGTKQVSLFSAPRIKVEQELVSSFHTGGGQRGGMIRQGVDLGLKFVNSPENNLGRPMPGGLVRVFMPSSDGMQLLAGESSISHVAQGGEVRLAIGKAFDVGVERKQVRYTKTGKNSSEIQWQIIVRNGKDIPQKVKLRDFIPGQWEIVQADSEYVKIDSGTIEFDLGEVLPDKGTDGKIINYTVQISY